MPDQPQADQRQEESGVTSDRAGEPELMTEQPAAFAKSHARTRRARLRICAVQQPLAAGAVLSRPGRRLAVLLLKFMRMLGEFILHAPGAKRGRDHSGRAQPDRRHAGRQSDPDRGVFRLREFRLADRPVGAIRTGRIWITKIDFAGLKQKLLASIVAISAIQVLEAFLNIDANFDATQDDLAGRGASGVRDLGAAAGDVGPLEQRSWKWRVANGKGRIANGE